MKNTSKKIISYIFPVFIGLIVLITTYLSFARIVRQYELAYGVPQSIIWLTKMVNVLAPLLGGITTGYFAGSNYKKHALTLGILHSVIPVILNVISYVYPQKFISNKLSIQEGRAWALSIFPNLLTSAIILICLILVGGYIGYKLKINTSKKDYAS